VPRTSGNAKAKQVMSILKLRSEGKLNYEIAKELGVTERIVSTEIYRAKKRGEDVPPFPWRDRSRAHA
jgi:DNA-binding NarL/FixJ family response regulator